MGDPTTSVEHLTRLLDFVISFDHVSVEAILSRSSAGFVLPASFELPALFRRRSMQECVLDLVAATEETITLDDKDVLCIDTQHVQEIIQHTFARSPENIEKLIQGLMNGQGRTLFVALVLWGKEIEPIGQQIHNKMLAALLATSI